MGYLNRVWMAASVAVVNGQHDQGSKLKSGLKSLHHSKTRFSSSSSPAADPSDLRPLAGVVGSDLGVIRSGGDERKNQVDESLRQVMYLNCWGPS